MGDGTSVFTVLVEDHPIRARIATRVRVKGIQDREFLVGARHREIKSFPVVEGVRVVVAANGVARLE